MIRGIVYTALVMLAVCIPAGWIYGYEQHEMGREEVAGEQARAAVWLFQKLYAARRESNLRLATVAAENQKREASFNAQIDKYKAKDKTYAAWLSLRVHPFDATLYDGLLDDTARSADGLPPRR